MNSSSQPIAIQGYTSPNESAKTINIQPVTQQQQLPHHPSSNVNFNSITSGNQPANAPIIPPQNNHNSSNQNLPPYTNMRVKPTPMPNIEINNRDRSKDKHRDIVKQLSSPGSLTNGNMIGPNSSMPQISNFYLPGLTSPDSQSSLNQAPTQQIRMPLQPSNQQASQPQNQILNSIQNLNINSPTPQPSFNKLVNVHHTQPHHTSLANQHTPNNANIPSQIGVHQLDNPMMNAVNIKNSYVQGTPTDNLPLGNNAYSLQPGNTLKVQNVNNNLVNNSLNGDNISVTQSYQGPIKSNTTYITPQTHNSYSVLQPPQPLSNPNNNENHSNRSLPTDTIHPNGEYIYGYNVVGSAQPPNNTNQQQQQQQQQPPNMLQNQQPVNRKHHSIHQQHISHQSQPQLQQAGPMGLNKPQNSNQILNSPHQYSSLNNNNSQTNIQQVPPINPPLAPPIPLNQQQQPISQPVIPVDDVEGEQNLPSPHFRTSVVPPPIRLNANGTQADFTPQSTTDKGCSESGSANPNSSKKSNPLTNNQFQYINRVNPQQFVPMCENNLVINKNSQSIGGSSPEFQQLLLEKLDNINIQMASCNNNAVQIPSRDNSQGTVTSDFFGNSQSDYSKVFLSKEVQDRLNFLNNEIENIQSNLREKANENNSLKEEINNYEQATSALQETVATLQKQNQDLQHRLVQNEEQLSKIKSDQSKNNLTQNSNLEAEILQYKTIISQMEKMLNSKNLDIVTLQRKSKEAQDSLEQQILALLDGNDKLLQRETHTSEVISHMEAEKNCLIQENRVLKDQYDFWKSEIEKYKSQLGTVAEADNKAVETYKREIQELKRNIDEYSQAFKQMQTQSTDEINRLRNENEDFRNQLNQYSNAYTQLDATTKDHMNQLVEENNQFRVKISQLEQNQHKEIQGLINENNVILTNLTAQKRQNEQFQARLIDLNEQLTSLCDRVTALDDENNQLRMEQEGHEQQINLMNQDWENKEKNYINEINKISKEVESKIREKFRDLERQNVQIKQEKDQLLEKLGLMINQNERILAINEQKLLESQNNEQNFNIAAAQEHIQNLEAEIKEWQNKVNELQSAVEDQRCLNDDLEMCQQNTEDLVKEKIEYWEQLIDQVNQQNEILRQQNENLQYQNQQIQRDFSEEINQRSQTEFSEEQIGQIQTGYQLIVQKGKLEVYSLQTQLNQTQTFLENSQNENKKLFELLQLRRNELAMMQEKQN